MFPNNFLKNFTEKCAKYYSLCYNKLIFKFLQRKKNNALRVIFVAALLHLALCICYACPDATFLIIPTRHARHERAHIWGSHARKSNTASHPFQLPVKRNY
jgi:hypothetical protein